MKRRAYLGVLSTVVAGCASSSPGEETPIQTSSPSPTATDSPTPTATEQEPTATKTETATPGPSDLELALDTAEEHLEAALDAYTGQNADLLDVTAASSVSKDTVREPLYDARDELNAAQSELDNDSPDGLRDRYNQLRGVYWFFWWGGSVQEELGSALNDLQGSLTLIYEADRFNAEIDFENVDEHLAGAQEALDNLTDDFGQADMASFDPITGQDSRKKLGQWNIEIEAFGDVQQLLRTSLVGFESVDSALSQYESRNYQTASSEFYDASSTFGDVTERTSGDDWEPAFDSILQDVECVAEAMEAGCDELDTAATAGANENYDKQEAARENAKSDFEGCDIVMDEVIPIKDFY